MRKTLILTAVLFAIPGMAWAGGGGVDLSGCAGFSTGSSVVMRDSCFAGTAHFAPAGSDVVIRNDGQLPHTLTAVDGTFDTGMVDAGGQAVLNFDTPGIYEVFCTLHGTAAGEGMAGVVIVGEPVPGAVAPSVDLTPVETAVAEQTSVLLAAMDNQGRAMGRISATQDDIAASLQAAPDSGTAAPPVPQVVVEADPGATIAYLVVGLAAGLAIPALAIAWRAARSDPNPRLHLDPMPE